MYPHTIQFETRFQDSARRLQLAAERAAAVREARPRRRRTRLSLRALGGGATAAFA
jgi:hypothetical protein